MTPQVSDFILGSLEDTDKYIGVADRHYVAANQILQVQIRMCDNNGYSFIATLYNVLLAPDICYSLFLIIMLMDSEHTCLLQKWFYMVTFCDNKKNAVTLPHSAQRTQAFLVKSKEKTKF